MSKQPVAFMSVSDFKTLMSISKIDILIDKETQLKSFKVNNVWFPVQKDLDTKLPMMFITELIDNEPNWMKATLINVDDSKAPKAVFDSI